MPQTTAGWALLVAVVLFAAFLLLKSRFSLIPGSPPRAEAKKRIAAAKKRARRSGKDREARGRAWREAGRIALDELGRPGLGASYALRAARVSADDVEAIELYVEALRRAKRYRALERFLWRRLRGREGPAYDRAYDELLALYEGPLRRRERADALRAMRQRVSEAPPAI